MFAKLLTALVLAVVVGVAVFSLRQQRLELMHEITVLHRQMNRDRQATWDTQARIADRTGPRALHDALTRAGVVMEPAVTEVEVEDGPGTPFADARHE
jgi:cell division protein FtsL